ncbi:MAG: 5-bromo-4-chloroindolyl phosphate hydrolysis family protein, partial [Paenisporosarcina sp.]
MLHVVYFIIRHLISFSIFITSWITLQFGTDIKFFIAGLISVGIYVLSVNVIKKVQSRLIIKKYNMTLPEYKHVQQQLKEAKLKLNKLNGYFIKVRSIRAFKQLFEMNRLAKRIFQIVRTNPKKFYH